MTLQRFAFGLSRSIFTNLYISRFLSLFDQNPDDFGAGRENRTFSMNGFSIIKIEARCFSRFYCRKCIAKSSAKIQTQNAVGTFYTGIFPARRHGLLPPRASHARRRPACRRPGA
jgi:hypothetical protein